nr:MAG TPA: hypothetical protein [Caudoviricetes sp.]
MIVYMMQGTNAFMYLMSSTSVVVSLMKWQRQ